MTDERMPQPDSAAGAGAGAPDPGAVPSVPAPSAPPAPAPPASAPSVPVSPVPPVPPVVEAPSPDVELASDASPLPGSHRGGFLRLPTAPVPLTVESAPAEPSTEIGSASDVWLAAGEPAVHRGLAGWALVFAILGLVVSLFVGWGFPIGLVAIVSAILALRRPIESRALAIWALVIGVVSVLYSAGWLLYAAMQSNFFG